MMRDAEGYVQHHRLAAGAYASLLAAYLLFAWLFSLAQHVSFSAGIYWAVTTATTVGYGDITPHGWAAHVVAVAAMLTAIPLYSLTIAFFTAWYVSRDTRHAAHTIKRHVSAEHEATREAANG